MAEREEGAVVRGAVEGGGRATRVAALLSASPTPPRQARALEQCLHRATLEPELRRAETVDLPVLTSICAATFPHSLHWRNSGFARRWWLATLHSAAAETWSLWYGGAVTGLLVVVCDEGSWNHEQPLRFRGWGRRLAAALCAPRVAAHSLLHQIRGRTSRRSSACAPIDLPAPAERVWLELVAVAPAAQGLGLGRLLLEWCEARARRRARLSVILSVHNDNRAAHHFYERCGYSVWRRTADHRLYGRRLVGSGA